MKKPENLKDLLKLQKQLDEAVSEKRDNGFIPRPRTVQDILLSLDDEFQEWLRELPYEYNFKTWKQREYNREKEIEEFADILFFFLQLINKYSESEIYTLREMCCLTFEEDLTKYKTNIMTFIIDFKRKLWNNDYVGAFKSYLIIATKRKISKDELIEEYFKKWEKNFKRIKGDWSL